ncbi:MAG: translation initiation factor IF-3 [Spirochaetales bacterium]|nr:MAG: translation initiation factor IF-3 [Spirochaetales bacterium]
MAVTELRINEAIRVKEVRLIDENGEPMGVVPIDKALEMAKAAELDLIEVAPQAEPPVCKILDYGKFKFSQEKKIKESKKKQKLIKMKEIRMQPKIEEHDMQFKTRHNRDFLDGGNKVKVTVRFRGRELAHTERGKDVLDKVLELLEGSFILERSPIMEGRYMSMTISPKGKK